MSVLYVDQDAFGGEFSGWGHEMSMKVLAAAPGECMWAINSLSNLARYACTARRWFEPFQYISGRAQPLWLESDAKLTSYLVFPDTQAKGIDTIHGRVDFLQLVGITYQNSTGWLVTRLRELSSGLANSQDELPPSGVQQSGVRRT